MCVLCEIQVHKHRVLYDVHILKNETAEQQQQQEKKTCSWNNVYQSKAEAAHSRLILSSRLVLNMKWTVKIERCAYTSCGFRSLLPVLSFHFAHRFGSSCFKWLCTFDHSKWFVCDSLERSIGFETLPLPWESADHETNVKHSSWIPSNTQTKLSTHSLSHTHTRASPFLRNR